MLASLLISAMVPYLGLACMAMDPGEEPMAGCKLYAYDETLCKAIMGTKFQCSAPAKLTATTIECPPLFPEMITLTPTVAESRTYQSAACDTTSGQWTFSRKTPVPFSNKPPADLQKIGCTNFK